MRGEPASDITVGVQLQNDNIFNGLYNTRARQRLSTTREDHIVETSVGVFVESAHALERRRCAPWPACAPTATASRCAATWPPIPARAQRHLASPSLSLVVRAVAATEFYFNYGRGFHSNDARGTLATIDPKTGEPVDRAPGLVRSRGMELGLRTRSRSRSCKPRCRCTGSTSTPS